MSKDSMGDGPYRVGNHSPLNVWCEPGQSTTEQVCMATSPRWAGRIVAALNEQDAHGVGERAVSDAVASAHLSGVDLPADWVDTLGKVARGEVTADDAVQAVVDSAPESGPTLAELSLTPEERAVHGRRDCVAAGLWLHDQDEGNNPFAADWNSASNKSQDAYLARADAAIAALESWQKARPAVDSELRDRIAANLTRHLYWHPGRCECGWKVNETGDVDWQAQFRAHVVQSIADEAVAPMLAAKDAQLKFTEATRRQYVEERDEALDDVERLRPALSKALADLVVRRQALANVLGVTDAGGASGYYRMIQDVADLRAELGAIRARAQLAEDERDKANRQNESLARRLHLRFQNEQKLSAELAAVKAGAVVVPESLRTHAQSTLDFLIPLWRAHAGGGQPDTEATEQAPREPRVWFKGDIEQPVDVKLRDRHEDVWTPLPNGMWCFVDEALVHFHHPWSTVVATCGPMTEVIEEGTQ